MLLTSYLEMVKSDLDVSFSKIISFIIPIIELTASQQEQKKIALCAMQINFFWPYDPLFFFIK